MRAITLPVVASVLAAAALLAAPAQASAQGLGLEVGEELPDFTITDLDGNEVQIRQVIAPGKPAVIEIWATWCTICRALQPQIEAIVGAHGDEVSVVAIAIAVNQTQEDVKAHVARFDHAWPFLWDGAGRAVRALNAGATGIVMMIDRDGKVAYTGAGARQDLLAEVEKLLGDR
jgi:thiol-disulfide isomerase/thioredoxin